VIDRERIGADTTKAALGNCRMYAGPTAVHVSASPPYVLTAAIPGRPLNRVTFTQFWTPRIVASKALEDAFATFGMLTAKLHSAGQPDARTAPATTRPFSRVRQLLDGLERRDSITEAISSWFASNALTDDGTVFVHGNLRLDNVLLAGTRIAFIDFENCGTGTRYQDMSTPVSDLLLTRCVLGLPKTRAQACLSTYVAAYHDVYPVDHSILMRYIAVRVARYYLENFTKPPFSVRKGGLPLSLGRLARLTEMVLQEEWRSVFHH
jgi:Ser/Thr protein kinase RdoA (MazF antagonist)